MTAPGSHERLDAHVPDETPSGARRARERRFAEEGALPESLAERRFDRARQQAVTVIIALAIPLAAFGVNDYLFAEGDPWRFAFLLSGRMAVLAAMVWAAVALHRAPTRERFEQLLLGAMWAAVVISVLMHLSRPRHELVAARWELLSVVGFYVAIPLRLRRGALPALVLSSLSVLLAFTWHTGVSMPDKISLLVSFGLANALGYLIGRQREAAADEEEVAWRALTTVNANLRTTLRELRTLQSVVPVCPTCRKVRGDERGWQQLEAYVAERGDTAFSAILCPDCLQRQFGAVLPEKTPGG